MEDLKLYKRFLLVLAVFSLFSLGIQLVPSASAELTPHDPIYISGNSDFSDGDDDGVVNPGASGTENDPYIIENWRINFYDSPGIHIENTTASFAVRDCSLENGAWAVSGIYLENVENGRVENCRIEASGSPSLTFCAEKSPS